MPDALANYMDRKAKHTQTMQMSIGTERGKQEAASNNAVGHFMTLAKLKNDKLADSVEKLKICEP